MNPVKAREILKLAERVKLPDLLWHDEFLNLTVHDVLTLGNSLLAEFNGKISQKCSNYYTAVRLGGRKGLKERAFKG